MNARLLNAVHVGRYYLRIVSRVLAALAMPLCVVFGLLAAWDEQWERGSFWMLFAILLFLLDEAETMRAAARRRLVVRVPQQRIEAVR